MIIIPAIDLIDAKVVRLKKVLWKMQQNMGMTLVILP